MISTRDDARTKIEQAGITSKNVTDYQLLLLHSWIHQKMVQSENYRGTYRMNNEVSKFMTCRTDQWESREAVSFNSDGFIGFAGWADNKNIRPILDGVEAWLAELEPDPTLESE